MLIKFLSARLWLALPLALWIGLSIYTFVVTGRTARLHDHRAQIWAERSGPGRWVREDPEVERLRALNQAAQVRTAGLQTLTFNLLFAYLMVLQLQLADAKRRSKDTAAIVTDAASSPAERC